MKQLIDIPELKQRASRIGLPMRALAEAADVSLTTLWRGVDSIAKRERLQVALFAREIRARDELLALHPLREGNGEARNKAVENEPGCDRVEEQGAVATAQG